MAKLHFRSYTTNQMVLFPQRIDENIAENDPVRIVSGSEEKYWGCFFCFIVFCIFAL